jgi:hypothetical protein
MEKKYGDYIIEYAKREFACANFDETELSKSMLNFLEECAKFTNHEPESMRKFVDIFHMLLHRFPIVPITENDFVEEFPAPNYKILKCTRYEYIYRTPDGRYWNDRALGFRYKGSSDNDVFYDASSKQQIELPYYPDNKIMLIDRP